MEMVGGNIRRKRRSLNLHRKYTSRRCNFVLTPARTRGLTSLLLSGRES
jgi:hypothetical protein